MKQSISSKLKQKSYLFTLGLHILALLFTFSKVRAESNQNVERVNSSSQIEKTRFISEIKLGLRYSNATDLRGVEVNSNYQLLPVVALFFLDNKIEFLMSSLSYRDYIIQNQLRFRTRLQIVSDNAFLPQNKNENLADRNESYEWFNRLEYFYPDYQDFITEINVSLSKDLKEHHGLYSEVISKTKLFEVQIPLAKYNLKIEPNLFLSTGYGDDRHNEYLYGASDAAALSNFSYGLWFHFPELTDRSNCALMNKHYELLTQKLKDSELLKNSKKSGWVINLVATYPLKF